MTIRSGKMTPNPPISLVVDNVAKPGMIDFENIDELEGRVFAERLTKNLFVVDKKETMAKKRKKRKSKRF